MAPALADRPTPEELHRARLVAPDGPAAVSNVGYLRSRPPEERARLAGTIARKPTRSLSGVAVVAVMTAPARCPHGRCNYCPGGLESRSPQSYTGEEPSALRGAQFHYDAEQIVRHRLAALEEIGHATSKVEVIVMGGTFPSRPLTYRRSVLKGIYDGLNGARSANLEAARDLNEHAEHRLVGLTVETRPDWCDAAVLDPLLESGLTRVELGVECLEETVLRAVGRAHGVAEVLAASRSARDRGLKVGFHLMLGLPGMDPASDLAGFRRLWRDEELRPDFLKIYPTLVLPATPLYDEWRAGRYAPYDTPTAVELLAAIKREVPAWVRIHRIQRDIPARLIAAGVRTSNLRQLAQERLLREGNACRCLRCREPGRGAGAEPADLQYSERSYRANGGEERFLAFEDPATDRCAAYLRLRFPPSPRPGALGDPVVRELKVVGRELPVGAPATTAETYQHRGLGRRLLEAAEEASRAAGFDRLVVISAVGSRAYYRRHGYERDGPYLALRLRPAAA
ncbi:MAG TPA: tRNA uridine(34) 5-carboxymethylaminomethyl modification radical SAM/GNAT enzyme Elp3 [Thermoplasmata archaeon]|nr:tRNA uridine(34) 5-carboxymethylaminomethyl modification radical SAM/GNAT enzyme Elp3 [Thermoplasmata archaeon]